MIQYSVEFTTQAKSDFDSLKEFCVKRESLSIENLANKILALETMPERFPFFEEEPWIQKEIRICRDDDICIFYYINKETKIVYIVRIFYTETAAVQTKKIVSEKIN